MSPDVHSCDCLILNLAQAETNLHSFCKISTTPEKLSLTICGVTPQNKVLYSYSCLDFHSLASAPIKMSQYYLYAPSNKALTILSPKTTPQSCADAPQQY